jgi:DNA-directed RNA polymerase specialized sigma24 family protein
VTGALELTPTEKLVQELAGRGRKVDEIAQLTHMTEQAVKTALARARNKMKQMNEATE